MLASTEVLGTPQNPYVRHGTDENLHVEFYKNITTGKDHIKMLIPGDKHFQPDRPVTDVDKKRFRAQWERYENNLNQFESQTMLDEVAWLDPGTKNILRLNQIFTLDQLATVSDANLKNVGHGAREMRQRAIEHLEERDRNAANASASAELQELRDQVARLEALVDRQSQAQDQAIAGGAAEQDSPPAAAPEPAPEPRTEPDELSGLGIQHIGGAWYKLPSGQKVKGRDTAIKAVRKAAE